MDVLILGTKLSSGWTPSGQMVEGWRFSCSNKGWATNAHGLQWLHRCFEPRVKAGGKSRMFILNGHESHTTGEFIAHCMGNMYLLRLPPHTSPLLQLLDVGLFGPLKKALSAALDHIIRTEGDKVRKVEWVKGYAEARQREFTVDNALGGWRGAGLFPYDPVKVLRHINVVDESHNPMTAMGKDQAKCRKRKVGEIDSGTESDYDDDCG